MKIKFSRQFSFSKTAQIRKFMKIHPVKNELLHTDGRKDGYEEANSRFWQFGEST